MPAALAAPLPGPSASANRAALIAFSVIELGACLGMLVLLAMCASTERLRRNPVLLNFSLVFCLTAGGAALLIWTGHPFDDVPPHGLCLANAAFVTCLAAAKAAAAFALTYKVWSQLMMVNHPQSKFLLFTSSSVLLIAIPWVALLPIFIGTIIIGVRDPTLILRNSIYYCEIQNQHLGLVDIFVAAVFEVMALILAAWSAVLVVGARRRVRSSVARPTHRRPHNGVHQTTIVRVLLFAVVLAGALAVELVIILNSPHGPQFGLTIATIDFMALAIFASDPVLFRSLLRRVRGRDTLSHGASSGNSSGATGGAPAISIALSVSTHTHTASASLRNERPWEQHAAVWQHPYGVYPPHMPATKSSAEVRIDGRNGAGNFLDLEDKVASDIMNDDA